MKNIAILDESGTLQPSRPSGEKSRPEAVLVSPLDLHTYIVPLPPLRQDQIAGAVRYRLRALHPGNPDTARVDYKPNGNAGKSVIAFVTEPSIQERYRVAGLPAIAPISFMRKLAAKDDEKWIGLFCTDRWIEASLFQGTEIISIEAIPALSYESERIAILIKTVAGENPFTEMPIRVVVVPGLSPGAESIETPLRAAGATVQVSDAGSLPSRQILAEGALFLDAPKRRLGIARLLALLLFVDAVLAVVSVHRIADRRERELRDVKTFYSSTKEQRAKQEEAIRELDELETRYAAYAKSRSVDTYAVMAEIARCIGEGAWIKDLAIRGNSFAIEAEGTDALMVLTRFSESSRFRSVTLHQAERSAEKGESFSISGTIRDDR